MQHVSCLERYDKAPDRESFWSTCAVGVVLVPMDPADMQVVKSDALEDLTEEKISVLKVQRGRC